MSVCTGEPEVLDPEKILTMIVEESPAAVPAAPENAGLLLLSVLPFAGLVNVTLGGDGVDRPRGTRGRRVHFA